MTNEGLADRRLRILRELLDIFEGRAPLERTDDLLHEDLTVHMDRFSFGGREGWKKWIRHSLATWRFEDVSFEVEDLEVNGDRLDVSITAIGIPRGGGPPTRSEPGKFSYRFQGERVVEIRTTRKNYGYLYGEGFTRLPGFLGHVGKVLIWNLRRR